MTLSKLVFPAWMICRLPFNSASSRNWKILLFLLSALLIEQEMVETKAKGPRKALQLNSRPLDTSSYARRTRKRFLIMKRPKNEISIRSQLNEFFPRLLFVLSLYVLLTRSMSRHVLFKLEPTARHYQAITGILTIKLFLRSLARLNSHDLVELSNNLEPFLLPCCFNNNNLLAAWCSMS